MPNSKAAAFLKHFAAAEYICRAAKLVGAAAEEDAMPRRNDHIGGLEPGFEPVDPPAHKGSRSWKSSGHRTTCNTPDKRGEHDTAAMTSPPALSPATSDFAEYRTEGRSLTVNG
jgi:hypothetical protein